MASAGKRKTTAVPRSVNLPIEVGSLAVCYTVFNATYSVLDENPTNVAISGTVAGAATTALQHATHSRLYPESLMESRCLPAGHLAKDILRGAPSWGLAFVVADMFRLGVYRTRQAGGSVSAEDCAHRLQDPWVHAVNVLAGAVGGVAGKSMSLMSWYGPVPAPMLNPGTPQVQRMALLAATGGRMGLAFGLFGVLDLLTGFEAHPERWISSNAPLTK